VQTKTSAVSSTRAQTSQQLTANLRRPSVASSTRALQVSRPKSESRASKSPAVSSTRVHPRPSAVSSSNAGANEDVRNRIETGATKPSADAGAPKAARVDADASKVLCPTARHTPRRPHVAWTHRPVPESTRTKGRSPAQNGCNQVVRSIIGTGAIEEVCFDADANKVVRNPHHREIEDVCIDADA
jgi:hypothetical protein